MPRRSPLVTFFAVALALKKIALQIRFFSVLLDVENRGLDANACHPQVISGRAVRNGPTASSLPSKLRLEACSDSDMD